MTDWTHPVASKGATERYAGELRAGAVRPGPIDARIWIDQDMKQKMRY